MDQVKAAESRSDVEYRECLHLRLIDCAARRAQLDCVEGELLVEMKRLELWRHFGCSSALEYMERVLGHAPHAALERLRVALELEQLPQMKCRLREGALCFSAVRELTRVVTPNTEGEWIAAATDKNVREIEELVAHHTKGDLPGDSPDPTPRVCKVRFERVKPETVAMIRHVRNALDAQRGGGRMDDDTFLQTLCRLALDPSEHDTNDAGASPEVDPDVDGDRAASTAETTKRTTRTTQTKRTKRTTRATAPAYQMAIITCKRCDRTWQNGSGATWLVDPEVIERAACDATFLGDLDAAVPARVTQSVTPRKREQVFARDGFRCVVSGCRSARGLDIHHIDPQVEGGGHELSNLCLLCSGHHRELHEGKLSLSGNAPTALVLAWARQAWWRSHVGTSSADAPVGAASDSAAQSSYSLACTACAIALYAKAIATMAVSSVFARNARRRRSIGAWPRSPMGGGDWPSSGFSTKTHRHCPGTRRMRWCSRGPGRRGGGPTWERPPPTHLSAPRAIRPRSPRTRLHAQRARSRATPRPSARWRAQDA